jgi:hypothetical protein
MDEYFEFWGLPYTYGIVPVDESPSRQPASSAPSYETPYWIDTINRGIERAAQVATVAVGGYPSYPNYPAQAPQPVPMPMPAPAPGVQPQQAGSGIQLSQTTLMLLVGGVLLFMLGKRGR